MKKNLVLLAFLAIGSIALAQEKSIGDDTSKKNDGTRRRGYIGLTIGASFPLGDFAKKTDFANGTGITGPESTSTGLQLNVVNFGYLFSDNFGISATWFGAAYERKSNRGYKLDPWSCGGIMVGPLISIPMSDMLEWDIRPMLGYSVCSGQPENGGMSVSESSTALALNLGSVFRIHIAKRASMLLTIDYLSTKLKFKDYGANWPGAEEQPIKTLTLGLGLAYRLR